MIRRCGNCGAEWEDDGIFDCYSCEGDNTYLLPADIDKIPNNEKKIENSKFLSGAELKYKIRKIGK